MVVGDIGHGEAGLDQAVTCRLIEAQLAGWLDEATEHRIGEVASRLLSHDNISETVVDATCNHARLNAADSRKARETHLAWVRTT